MKFFLHAALFFGASFILSAQMSTEQRLVDFQQLAALIAKRYSFVEWKQNAFQYDALDLQPWMTRIRAAKDDLEFYEICTEYIAKLQDGHSGFSTPSTFIANLNFGVDLVENKVIVDSIARTALPIEKFPFQIGDEVVSIDGKPVLERLAAIQPFYGSGSPRAAARFAVQFLTIRNQSFLPRAAEVGESAEVVIRRREGGAIETYQIPWVKSGLALVNAGPVPTPKTQRPSSTAVGIDAPVEGPDGLPSPDYMATVRQKANFRSNWIALTNETGAQEQKFLAGVGAIAPVFDLPAGFVNRRGLGRFDNYSSGTFESGGVKFGFIRIPQFAGVSADFDAEIEFMERNTDGLIVDIMRNPGGSGCTMESLARRLAPDGLLGLAVSTRVTWEQILSLESSLRFAELFGASASEIEEIKRMLGEFRSAFSKPRGFTFLEPICSNSRALPAYTDRTGKQIAYSKPVVLLIDDLSSSAAEGFAAMMQDNKRALLYGYRTGGLGGAVLSTNVGFYMEARTRYTYSILVRSTISTVPGYPAEPYIENIGVHPDKVSDTATVEFIATRGKDWVEKMVSEAVEYVNAKKTTTLP